MDLRRSGRACWTGYRALRNLPVSVLALLWARRHGATITLGDDLFVECSGMPRGSFGRGGTTVGNVWLYGDLGGPRRRRHELRHADQYALLGTTPFLALYGLNALVTRNRPQHNVFERWAGLEDGGYRPARREPQEGTTTSSRGSSRTRTARTATSSSA